MSIASEITRINTNIANSYTAVDGKGGTLPQVQNSANLATAIDSIEVIEQQTAEGESLSLANTKAMPYSDYVVEGKSEQEGTPSPSNPSEIHSVADDVNLFNSVDRSQERYGMTCNIKDNRITINGTATRNNFSGTYFNINGSQNANANYYDFDNTTDGITLPAGKYTLSLYNIVGTYTTTQEVNIRISKVYSGSTPTTTLASIILTSNETSKTFTLSEQATIKIRMQVRVSSDTSVAVPVFNNYSFDLKLQEGSISTSYSPYNQGTVTIKQRGKNLFDYAKASDTNNTYITQYRIFEIDNLKPNTHYNINNMGFTAKLDNQYCYLWDTDTYSTSNKYLLAYVNQYNTKASFISNNEGKIYLAIYPTDTTTWESVISYLENAQIEERKQFNPLRTISNTTRLYYTNRTIT